MEQPHYLDKIPAQAKWLHTSVYDVRWADMDAFGHVNNAVYFTYFEQARIDWLRSIGARHGIVLATVGCTFKRAIVYPARIQVRLYAGSPRRSSVDSYYEISDCADAEVIYTVGHGTIVWFDHQSGVSVEIPPEIRKLLR